MKIAIPNENGFVSAHFGRCPIFTIVEIENGVVINRENISNPGHRRGFLPEFFNKMGVNCIIAGGMGTNATGLFSQYNIQTLLGITGDIDSVIDKIKNGRLEGGESLCTPGGGRGYGINKEKD